jgi:hypothetical protein
MLFTEYVAIAGFIASLLVRYINQLAINFLYTLTIYFAEGNVMQAYHRVAYTPFSYIAHQGTRFTNGSFGQA